MPESTWRIFRIFVTVRNFSLLSEELSSLLPVFEDVSPPSSVLAFEFGAGEDDRPFIWPLHKSPCASSWWLKLRESLLEHCPCAFHWTRSPAFLSTQDFCPVWLLVTDPLSTTSFRTLKFLVLIIWHIWSFTDVFNLEKLTCPLFRMVSWSYNAKTVWSWTESCNLDSYNPSRITSEGISLADNRAWSHPTSKSWTSSFCELILNKSDRPCTASWAPVARKCS